MVTGYDVVALNHINRPLSYPRAALAGFLASTFGSNLGFAMVTGGAIRYRLYSQGGLSAVEIAGIKTMRALTVTLGIGFILTLSLLFGSAEATAFSPPLGVKRTLGAVMLGLAVVIIFAGMMLLFSSAVPAPAGRLGLLREAAPLALVEVFHALAGAGRDRARDPSARLVPASQRGLSFDRRSARAGYRGLSSQSGSTA
ncbi:MAG: hypothetical protein ACHBMF_11765 [Chromatiales bacterium]